MHNPTNYPMLLVLVLISSACGQGAPCADSECASADLDGSTCADCDDLPCGGADLQSDNENCGSCENQCPVRNPGTPYEAGTCEAGTCGPVWYELQFDPIPFDATLPPEASCDEVCASFSSSCVAQGCSGKTGYVCSSLFGQGCSLTDPYQYPADWTGECDQAVPWPEFLSGWVPRLGCCCRLSG